MSNDDGDNGYNNDYCDDNRYLLSDFHGVFIDVFANLALSTKTQ